MKRNMELIRRIVLKVEDQPEAIADLTASAWPEDDEDAVNYHLQLLIEAKVIEGSCQVRRSAIGHCKVQRLTWKGHELADAFRRDSVWGKIKQIAIDKGVDLTVDMIPLLFKQLVEG